ncbi:MAG TPA: GntG family PLP-dependent aldolase, partial [Rhodospirillales bacterium]|nr:GntG family PLP-dependent aldolase [Rhodospirillales bacterium]
AVGDDVYGDDPSVRALERRTAELLGKDDAVFMVSGTMTNQVALRAHTEAGDEVLADAAAHIAVLERGAPAALSGLTLRGLPGRHGIFSAEDVRQAIRTPHPFLPSVQPPTKLLCLENTHNIGGGSVWPIDALRDVVAAGRAAGLAVHLDGARLWNAAVATGIAEATWAEPFDTVSVCFSKGLGAPVGSALAGPAAFVARARRFKALFGGGIRQGGIVAAGALWALAHHRDRLADDHARARRLAQRLAEMSAIDIDPAAVATNIVRFRLRRLTAAAFVDACFARGVHMLPAGRSGVRAVTHLDVSDADTERACAVIEGVIADAPVLR